MIVTITPSSIQGSLNAPPSKSSMQRACAAALLRCGTSVLHNAGSSNDDLAALEVIQKLGADISINPDGSIIITSHGVHPTATEINCGESGLGIRMFAPIAALSDKPLKLTGKGSLNCRPMDFFDQIFPSLGIHIQSNNGKLPLHIQGPFVPADITVDGSMSSQFLTGLLMAFSAANAQATITVNNLISKPYVDLTLAVMQAFGLNVPVNNNYNSFTFHPLLTTKAIDLHYTVEGDWSSASFLLVGAAIAGSISLNGLDVRSAQADKAILHALRLAGCTPVIRENTVAICAATLKAFEFDATDCPDLFPPLVALAACCKGTTTIYGVTRLQHKESNRGLTLQQEFAKMGVEINIESNAMHIIGGNKIKGAIIDSHNDHRIAMACAIAGLSATDNVLITDAEAVDKSYPGFYSDLMKLQGLK